MGADSAAELPPDTTRLCRGCGRRCGRPSTLPEHPARVPAGRRCPASRTCSLVPAGGGAPRREARAAAFPAQPVRRSRRERPRRRRFLTAPQNPPGCRRSPSPRLEGALPRGLERSFPVALPGFAARWAEGTDSSAFPFSR